MEKSKHIIRFLLILSNVIIGLSFSFSKIALQHARSFDILAHRFLLAFLSISIYTVLSKHSLRVKKEDLKDVIGLALCYPLLSFSMQLLGLKYTSSTQSGLINALVPVFTAIFSAWLLKEYLSKIKVLGIILSVGGVVYLTLLQSSTSGESHVLGTVLLTISVIGFSLNTIYGRKLMRRYHFSTLTFWVLFVGTVVFFLIALSDHLLDGTAAEFIKPLFIPDYLVAIFYLGFMSSFITSIISFVALSKVTAVETAIFGGIATLTSILAGVLILQESFTLYHAIGALLIILGVFIVNQTKTPAIK